MGKKRKLLIDEGKDIPTRERLESRNVCHGRWGWFSGADGIRYGIIRDEAVAKLFVRSRTGRPSSLRSLALGQLLCWELTTRALSGTRVAVFVSLSPEDAQGGRLARLYPAFLGGRT